MKKILFLMSLLIIPDAYAEVYFNLDCQKVVIHNIQQSKEKIDVAVFSINNKDIVEALAEAKNRGVVVNIITDPMQAKQKHSICNDIRFNCVLKRGRENSGYMHHKFAIFDQKVAISGSYNWTNGGSYINSEDCNISKDVDDLKKFSEKFKLL
jgi:phosphatidylserine/phosphatidylglycerophosphate/cardiolipin synthase-like enzyme